jgi:glucose-6-phosphate 1-dehydrogenase
MLIIGGTGDLSRRHLLPALTRLLVNRELPEGFAVALTGLEPMSTEACRDLIAQALVEHAGYVPSDARRALTDRISYFKADVRDAHAVRGITAAEPVLIYVATPPTAVPGALQGVRHADLHRSSRIVLDKPFGLSRRSAEALNAQVLELVAESNVYRVDHFLYHHAVQELVRWRVESDPLSLADVLPLATVEIVWDETRAVHSSAFPYCGVVRDMIQSHLLQLTAVITMASPASMTRADLARNRLDALRRLANAADADSQPMRGHHVPSGPETFATLALRSEMPRWREVRFLLRAAKGVDQSRRHIEFRLAGQPGGPSPPFVRLEVLTGRLAIGAVGVGAPLEFALSADAESASTRLLRAALVGDDTFTLSAEEPEEAWRIVEPVLQAWEDSDGPMLTYEVGASAASIVSGGAERSDA